jgi:hypothetical protein
MQSATRQCRLHSPVRRWVAREAPSCTPPSRAHQGLVEAAWLPRHAERTAVPNAATRGGLHCARRRAHIARRHACTPEPALSRSAPDAPIAMVGFPPSLADPKTASSSFPVLESRFGLAGRGSCGEPATALGGACALHRVGVTDQACCGHDGARARVLTRHSTSTLRYSWGTLGVYHYRGAQGTMRSKLCRLERACANDLTCCCRGSSGSWRSSSRGSGRRRRRSLPVCRTRSSRWSWPRCRRAARGGLQGDHEAQGAPRGCLVCLRVRVGCTGDGRGPSMARVRVYRRGRAGLPSWSGRNLAYSGPMSGTTTCSRMLFRFPTRSGPSVMWKARAPVMAELRCRLARPGLLECARR